MEFKNYGRYTEYKAVYLPDNSPYNDGPTWRFWRQKRYWIAVLTFFGTFNVFALRSNLSIALVDMTTLKNVTLENNTIIAVKEFDLDSRMQGYILSSFFYGYILTQIIGGYLSSKFGGAKIFGLGVATTAIFTILTPWVAKRNVYLLIALRIVEGLFEGMNYPALLGIWAKWAPPLEKARLVAISLSGNYVGTLVTMPVSSLLATTFGWETIFYVTGGVAVFWYIIWVVVVKDCPSKDTSLSHQELTYITATINSNNPNRVKEIPWSCLLTSKVVYSLSFILSCETWGFHTLVAYLPRMMKSALNFDLNKSGFLSALPYVAMTLSVHLGAQLSDWIISKKYMSLTSVRKTTISVGFICQAIFLLAAGFWMSPEVTPILVAIALFFGGIALSGIVVNPLDVAPRFASIIHGINNTFGSIPGIVSPILTGYIVTDLTNVEQWKIILYITAGLYASGALASFLFITGEIQPWTISKKINGNNQTGDNEDKKEQFLLHNE